MGRPPPRPGSCCDTPVVAAPEMQAVAEKEEEAEKEAAEAEKVLAAELFADPPLEDEPTPKEEQTQAVVDDSIEGERLLVGAEEEAQCALEFKERQ